MSTSLSLSSSPLSPLLSSFFPQKNTVGRHGMRLIRVRLISFIFRFARVSETRACQQRDVVARCNDGDDDDNNNRTRRDANTETSYGAPRRASSLPEGSICSRCSCVSRPAASPLFSSSAAAYISFSRPLLLLLLLDSTRKYVAVAAAVAERPAPRSRPLPRPPPPLPFLRPRRLRAHGESAYMYACVFFLSSLFLSFSLSFSLFRPYLLSIALSLTLFPATVSRDLTKHALSVLPPSRSISHRLHAQHTPCVLSSSLFLVSPRIAYNEARIRVWCVCVRVCVCVYVCMWTGTQEMET